MNFQYTFKDLIIHFVCMVGSFFYAYNQNMDILKLCDKLFEDEEIQDIPLEYIFRVAYEVLIFIAEGDCFYRVDLD